MEYLFIIVIVVVGILFLVKINQVSSKSDSLPYISKGYLFSKAERSFYGVLKQAVGKQYEIFGQVRIADVLAVKKGMSRGERQGFFNKIKAKHVDFLLCDPKDLSIVAAIELDDKSHNQPKRIERDKFLYQAFKDARLPLIRFKAKASYSSNEIALNIQQNLGIKAKQDQNKKINTPSSYDDKILKKCPNCSSTMIRRKATSGEHAGSYFLACSNYPTCKMIAPIEVQS